MSEKFKLERAIIIENYLNNEIKIIYRGKDSYTATKIKTFKTFSQEYILPDGCIPLVTSLTFHSNLSNF